MEPQILWRFFWFGFIFKSKKTFFFWDGLFLFTWFRFFSFGDLPATSYIVYCLKLLSSKYWFCFSIRVLFAKFGALSRNKPYTHRYPTLKNWMNKRKIILIHLTIFITLTLLLFIFSEAILNKFAAGIHNVVMWLNLIICGTIGILVLTIISYLIFLKKQTQWKKDQFWLQQ